MAFYDGPRPETVPFFVAKDRVRPYTYSAASSDLRKFLKRVSPQDFAFGLHGLRVRGYNDACGGDCEELAVAHGGWRSSAHTRYARFPLSRVLELAPAMARVAGAPSGESEAAPAAAPAEGEAPGDESPESTGGAPASCEECEDDDEAPADEQPEDRLSIAQLVMSPISTIAERLAERRGRRL